MSSTRKWIKSGWWEGYPKADVRNASHRTGWIIFTNYYSSEFSGKTAKQQLVNSLCFLFFKLRNDRSEGPFAMLWKDSCSSSSGLGLACKSRHKLKSVYFVHCFFYWTGVGELKWKDAERIKFWHFLAGYFILSTGHPERRMHLYNQCKIGLGYDMPTPPFHCVWMLQSLSWVIAREDKKDGERKRNPCMSDWGKDIQSSFNLISPGERWLETSPRVG